MDKPARRRDCFARIRSLSDAQKRAFSGAIVEFIAGSRSFADGQTIFTYFALPSEPDLIALLSSHPEKQWAFPIVDRNESLSFYEVNSADDLRKGAHGFSEPDPSRCIAVPPHAADLIIVPGVSFDPKTLTRLGRGRGHYDRFLASARRGNKSPDILGVCFSIQFSTLEPEPHDIAMRRLITERGAVG